LKGPEPWTPHQNQPPPRSCRGRKQYRYASVRKTLDLHGDCIDITDQELVVGSVRAFVQSLLEAKVCGCGIEAKILWLRGTIIETSRGIPMPDESVDASLVVERLGVLGSMR
jgi:hypothetical protein